MTEPIPGSTPSETCIWLLLDRDGPLTQSEIADRTGLSRQTVSRALTSLKRLNAVESWPNPTDARVYCYESVTF